ncbi:DUF4241 domain-containing protein [Cellulomonas sp. P5_C5]
MVPSPTEVVGEHPTFVACGREPADPSVTNLRPSELTPTERAAVQDWGYGPLPDGRMVVEHVTDLTLPAGLLGFGDGFEASIGALGGERLREVAAPGTTAPVSLAVLDSPTSGRRVAFLEVRVAPQPPVRWEEVPSLGFGTDGGDGGVLAPGSLDEPAAASDATFERIEVMYPDSDSASGNVCVLRSTRDHVDGVVFSSGWGDGGYPTFLGYDSAGQVVSVVSYGFVIPWELSGLPGTGPADATL